VFLFFFLNCLLIPVSFINASSITNNPAHSECPVQNHNSSESEKDPCPVNFSCELSDYYLSRQNVHDVKPVFKKENNLLYKPGAIRRHDFKNFFTASSCLIRPAYYTLLYLYKLF
jgi:hypothetical protein